MKVRKVKGDAPPKHLRPKCVGCLKPLAPRWDRVRSFGRDGELADAVIAAEATKGDAVRVRWHEHKTEKRVIATYPSIEVWNGWQGYAWTRGRNHACSLKCCEEFTRLIVCNGGMT